MLTERLQAPARCPSAQAIGIAVAAGYGLKFFKRSNDKSGKATLDKVAQPGRQVYGVLFKINKCQLPPLDRAEGKGKGYDRFDNFSVTVLPERTQVHVITYIASACAVDDSLKPYDWYRALVIWGAHQHKLPKTYIASLFEFASIIDQKQNRKTRLDAIETLRRAGVQDFTQIPDTS